VGGVWVVVVVLGGGYVFGAPKYEAWKDAVEVRKDIKDRMQLTERRLERREEWEKQLETFRGQLPSHPATKEVTAELLKSLEQTARKHSLTLLRREPEKEKHVGDLYEVAIRCTWQGDLGAVVHFLYAIQMQGAILDVRQLTVKPAKGDSEMLTGSFTVDYAYTREAEG
jgi:Tfp pilus assembly protein PilO